MNPRKTESAFNRWYESQFGKNGYKPSASLIKEMQNVRRHLEILQIEYKASRDHELRRDAALKAWCARD